MSIYIDADVACLKATSCCAKGHRCIRAETACVTKHPQRGQILAMKNIVFAGWCAAAVVAAGCSSAKKQATVEKSTAAANVEKASSAKPAQSDVAALQGSWNGRTSDPEHQCSFVVSGKNFEFHDKTDTNV